LMACRSFCRSPARPGVARYLALNLRAFWPAGRSTFSKIDIQIEGLQWQLDVLWQSSV
jgi:hypothetical protein